jgi:hypothetical protein
MSVIGVFLPKLLDMASMEDKKDHQGDSDWKEHPQNDWYCCTVGAINRLLTIARRIVWSTGEACCGSRRRAGGSWCSPFHSNYFAFKQVQP